MSMFRFGAALLALAGLCLAAHADNIADGQKLAFDRAKGNCLACHTMKGGDVSSTVGRQLNDMKRKFPDRKICRNPDRRKFAQSHCANAVAWSQSRSYVAGDREDHRFSLHAVIETLVRPQKPTKGYMIITDPLRRIIAALAVAGAFIATAAPVMAVDTPDPEGDRKALQAFFFAKFPKLPKEEFGNGPYAVNADMRKQWMEIMEFPPYELALDEGHTEWNKPFANGKHYADCFDNKGEGIRQTYPRFMTETGQVETLEGAINRCRVENGEKPLNPMTGLMASITAVMAESSRGKPFAISIPNDPRALAAYESGKEFFYSRKGQLGVSCASCHNSASGERLRGDILAPTLGIVAAMPIYRSDWGSMGTTIRRLSTCSSQTRALPLKPDDEDYRNLEYFLTYMSNGIPVSGPGTRP